MLHMTIAANVLNAIGGKPVINKPHFIPHYPGPLPLNIGDLIVPLAPISKTLVKKIFMEIEEPEDPIDFPDAALLAASSGVVARSGAVTAIVMSLTTCPKKPVAA